MKDIVFNLLDDPWIPCEMLSGEYKLLSIKDVLFNAQDIKEITSDNPLIVISINRLLLAILHRNFGPENKDKWNSIFKVGEWDKEILANYFKKWAINIVQTGFLKDFKHEKSREFLPTAFPF